MLCYGYMPIAIVFTVEFGFEYSRRSFFIGFSNNRNVFYYSRSAIDYSCMGDNSKTLAVHELSRYFNVSKFWSDANTAHSLSTKLAYKCATPPRTPISELIARTKQLICRRPVMNW